MLNDCLPSSSIDLSSSQPAHLLVRPRQALAHHLALERRPQRRRGPRPHGVARQAGLALLVDEQDKLNHRERK